MGGYASCMQAGQTLANRADDNRSDDRILPASPPAGARGRLITVFPPYPLFPQWRRSMYSRSLCHLSDVLAVVERRLAVVPGNCILGESGGHSPNTHSMVALRCSASSGVASSLVREVGLAPEAIATYCLPPA